MKSDLFMIMKSLKDPKRLEVLPTHRSEEELKIGADHFYMKRIGEHEYRLYSKNLVLWAGDSNYTIPCPKCGKPMARDTEPVNCCNLGTYICMNCRKTAKE